ncbi:beta strand repeat-containing protein [Cnuibacter sp. UC19_7]|uniref:beta strand repeat-containing protein n=1 Tax=Cnuibacter sp. UC19_7 TaxID=3350166 RepID=UPI0036730E00
MAPTGTTRRAKTRWAALAVVTGLLVAGPAAPSFAATFPVDDLGGLKLALTSCQTTPNTIILGGDISAPTTALTVYCDTTLDLGTHDLSVSNVVINPGTSLTVSGPTDGSGGTLTADASSLRVAGIKNTGATLTVTGGTVTARGGVGAGIGGSYDPTGAGGSATNLDAGTLNVAGGTVNAYAGSNSAAVGGAPGVSSRSGNGGTVTVSSGALNAYSDRPAGVAVGGGNVLSTGVVGSGANITVTGGTLTAMASASNGTAIGGGATLVDRESAGGSGGSLHVGPGGEVIAAAPENIFGGGWSVPGRKIGGDFGSLTVEGTLRLPSGRLSVPAGYGMSVGATGRIVGTVTDPTVGASFAGAGRISNQGSITLSPPAGMVDGYNTLFQFVPTAPSVSVFAPSFADGARTLPTPPPGTAWNTSARGSGTWFSSTSPTMAVTTMFLYAVAPATIVTPTDYTVAAGAPVSIPVTVNGVDGSPLSPQPSVDFAYDHCSLNDEGVFTVAGPCSVTASTTVRDVRVQKTFTIQIVPRLASSMTVSPYRTTVAEGSSIAFTMRAWDRYGNPIDTSAATLTSNRQSDVVKGHTVTFSGAGAHVITTRFQGFTLDSSITVVAGPVASLSISPTNPTVTQGDAIAFTITGTDAGGNPVDTTNATLTSGGHDLVGGHTVLFSGAGDHVVTATLDGVSTSTTVRVVAGPLATLSISPATATVVQGGTTAFTLTGTDAAGNPVNVDDATLTAAPTDTIDGHSIRFSGAGVRTVTATLNGITTTAEITVTPGPLSALTITPATQTVTQGDTTGFTITGTDTAGNPVDTSGAVLSSNIRADTITGTSVTFSGAGTHIVTATLDGVSTSASIEVVAGPLATLTVTPATATVTQSNTTVFTITGTDTAGNPVNVDAATLSSTAEKDVVDGRAVTFSGAGTRTITATLGDITATASIEVVAGPVATLTLTPTTATVTQDGSVDFTITGADAAGNPVDTTGAVLASNIGADTITGTSVTFSGAGTHIVTATLDGVSTSASIEVVAGPAATLTITPSAATVDQGGTLTFTVTGADSAGNPVDTSTVVLTSSVDTDVITGTTVTFPHASPHTITATLGTLTATVTIQVIPAPVPSPTTPPSASGAGLANTGLDGGAIGAIGTGALVLLLAGAAFLLIRRRDSADATPREFRP